MGGSAVLSREWTIGPGGVKHLVAAPDAHLVQARKAATDALKARDEATAAKAAARAARAEADGLLTQVKTLQVALAMALGHGYSRKWRGTICDDCGCLCRGSEACPWCLWVAQERRRS